MVGYDPVNLILMGNTLQFRSGDDVARIYDLKGSRVARSVNTKGSKPTTTLKDMNFFRNQSRDQEINLSKADRNQIR